MNFCLVLKCRAFPSMPYFPGKCSHMLHALFGLAVQKRGWCTFFEARSLRAFFSAHEAGAYNQIPEDLGLEKQHCLLQMRCDNSTLGLPFSLTEVHTKQSTVSAGIGQRGFASSGGANLLPGLTRQAICNGGRHTAVPLCPLRHLIL